MDTRKPAWVLVDSRRLFYGFLIMASPTAELALNLDKAAPLQCKELLLKWRDVSLQEFKDLTEEADSVIPVPASSSSLRINDLYKKQRVIFEQRQEFLFGDGLTLRSEVLLELRQSTPNSPQQLI